MKINTGCWVDGCKRFDPKDEDGVWIKKDRDWVDLTDDEMLMIYAQPHEGFKYSLGRMVQAKLKEKNGG
jgi:hypothetical protein